MGNFWTGNDASVNTQQLSNLTGSQDEVLGKLGQFLSSQVGQSGPQYAGDRVVGESPLQGQAFELLQQIMGGSGDLVKQAYDTQITPQGPNTETFDPTASKDYFNQAIAAPARQNFEDSVMPALMEKFQAIDGLDSGAARRAMGSATADFELGLNSQLSQLLEGERNTVRSNNLNANEAFAERDMTSQMANLDKLFGIPGFGQQLAALGLTGGGEQRGIAQQQRTGDIQKFDLENPTNNPAMQLLAPFLNTDAVENLSQATPASPGFLGSLGGSVASAAGSELVKNAPAIWDKVSSVDYSKFFGGGS